MNFFEHQHRAHKNTSSLILLFFLAIGSLINITTVLFHIVYFYYLKVPEPYVRHTWSFDRLFDDPIVLLKTSLLTLTIIGLGSLVKWVQLGNSGESIAKYLGGTLINSATKDIHERKLLNVVTEMSLAAGIVPPPVYVLKGQTGINAFAAGLTPSDSVIGITDVALEELNRDELQGVVAHEMSHIFNGDTRLNVRLISYLAGIVTIGLVGRMLLEVVFRTGRYRSTGRSRRSSSGGSSKGAGQLYIVLIVAGVSLWIIGSVGTFIGQMIKAAVSRQREFLADASAVQFTRYPQGIAGALAKISNSSSYIYGAKAEEMSHMCIEQPHAAFFVTGAMFSTHPPIDQRIARIDKRFLDPEFLKTVKERDKRVEIKSPKTGSSDSQKVNQPRDITEIMNSIGVPSPERVMAATVLMTGLNEVIKMSRTDLTKAKALVLGLLNISGKNNKIVSLIETYEPKEVVEAFKKIEKVLGEIPRTHVLPALELCIPIIREQSVSVRLSFLKTAEYLARMDSRLDLHELALLNVLQTQLKPREKRNSVREYRLSSLKTDVHLMISALALHKQKDKKQAQLA
ncbi:MAG: M48 family metalloprotease, partial [Bdellovibrionales bacterium]|nr:M48 family metalloprotease [Bdellovibrionales bacterium]NQZ19849.1 M48 family metalloprotease [Bdellovibrionales bacterium]